MKRIFTLTILVILSAQLFSQDILLEKEVALNSMFKDKRESFPIVNKDNGEILLFLLDNAEIKGFKFNMGYELTDEYTTKKPISKFKTLLGHSVDNDNYNLFFTNEKKNEFLVKKINIANKKATSEQISLPFKDERFLETISYNNKFYLLSIVKRSSKLKLYVFDGNSISSTKEFDFSKYQFSSTGFTKLFDVLLSENTSIFRLNLKIHKIDIRNPNPIDLTSKENKMYYYDNKIFISLDNNLEDTKVIKISLEDFSSKVKFYNQLEFDEEDIYTVKSNSYIFMDKLYQVKGNKHELGFRVIDLNSDSIISKYRVKANEEIKFSNTPFIQEGGTTIFNQGSEKVLSKTKQVLRKISASDIGITARLSDNNTELTIGGYKKVQRSTGASGGMMMTSPGTSLSTPHGTISTPPTYNYNPTMYGYSTYTNTRSVFFKSLLSNIDYNHVEGAVSDNPFDKIRDYEKDNDTGMSSKTIFKVDNYYILGYYKKWDKKYYLVKFEE